MARIDDQGAATPKRRKAPKPRTKLGIGHFTDNAGTIAQVQAREAFWEELQRFDVNHRVTGPILRPDPATAEQFRSASRRELNRYVAAWAKCWDIATPALIADALHAFYHAIHPPLRRHEWGDSPSRIRALSAEALRARQRLAQDIRFRRGLDIQLVDDAGAPLDWDPASEDREYARARLEATLRRRLTDALDRRERLYRQRAGGLVAKTRSIQVDSIRWLVEFQIGGLSYPQVAERFYLDRSSVEDGIKKAAESVGLTLREHGPKPRPALSRGRSIVYELRGLPD